MREGTLRPLSGNLRRKMLSRLGSFDSFLLLFLRDDLLGLSKESVHVLAVAIIVPFLVFDCGEMLVLCHLHV